MKKERTEMSEHTHREGNDEKRDGREKREGKQGRFLRGARTPVLKWEHDDRRLCIRGSQHPGLVRDGGGPSRNSPESITVTWRACLLARRGGHPQEQAGESRPLWSRTSAIPGFRGQPSPRGSSQERTAVSPARRLVGKKIVARLQRAVLLQSVGGRGQPASSWP
ncbi:hypothetical protein B0T14DRAFT_285697 [Immersiella caudata]|uniref:Uncharacterized protein n=1 Tax=Immersiella caudata TaxID=314043 RepID=A0AA39WE85_9PEZI|nr:hypothetical protein B0T14DRAFT_285697 [Immersiella caudata]